MVASLKAGCVIMAAGNGKRFGSNKLAAEFQGRSLFRHALESVPAQQLESVVVVTQYPEFISTIKEFRFTYILNHSPDSGQSHTIHLGINALRNCDGILFQVADQPLLRQETVSRLIALWQQQPHRIVALSHLGQRGNPCIFPARFFPELFDLTGDQGGSAVIRKHPEALTLLEVTKEELLDIDTVEALDQLSF